MEKYSITYKYLHPVGFSLMYRKFIIKQDKITQYDSCNFIFSLRIFLLKLKINSESYIRR